MLDYDKINNFYGLLYVSLFLKQPFVLLQSPFKRESSDNFCNPKNFKTFTLKTKEHSKDIASHKALIKLTKLHEIID